MIGFEYYNPAKIVFGEDSQEKLKDLLAQYKVKRPTYTGKYDAWQYSSKGQVDGITGNVDLDLNLSL